LYAHAFAPPPLASYGEVRVFGGSAPRRHSLTINAPGARELRIWQDNNGGHRHIKNHLGSKTTLKTWGKVKLKKADSPALVRVRVFWKKSAGGGSAWFGPRKVGSSGGTWNIQSPSGGSDDSDDSGGSGGGSGGSGGGSGGSGGGGGYDLGDGSTSYVDPSYVNDSYNTNPGGDAAGGTPGWLLPTAVVTAILIPLGAWAYAKSRD
jgi:hypothetical protein